MATGSEKAEFHSGETKFLQTHTYFCSLSIDDSNGILKLGESFQTKELMGLREQGMIASLAYPNRSYCKKKVWQNTFKTMWIYSLSDAESE